MRELVQNVLMNQKLQQGKLKEFAMSWLTNHKLEQGKTEREIRDELADR